MDDERLSVPSMTVYEADDGWYRTGLLDQNGTPLMARNASAPIGFLTEFNRPDKDR
jgi:hypothetical protein